MKTIVGDDAIIIRMLNKIELAVYRAKSKFTAHMTAHTLADAIVHELQQMSKEIEDANPAR